MTQPGDAPGIVLGLENAGHELDLEDPDGRSAGLQPKVIFEPAGQDVAAPVPPVRLARLLRDGQDPGPLPLTGHAVQGEQVINVARLEPDVTGFHPADLGPGRPDLVAGLLGRNAGSLAESAQLGAEQQAQDKAASWLAVHAGSWLPGVRRANAHHCSDTG